MSYKDLMQGHNPFDASTGMGFKSKRVPVTQTFQRGKLEWNNAGRWTKRSSQVVDLACVFCAFKTTVSITITITSIAILSLMICNINSNVDKKKQERYNNLSNDHKIHVSLQF